MTKNRSRLGKEPILKPHDRERGKALTKANHREDDLDRAGRLLAKLKADEPAMKQRIDRAFADMAEAREELALHLEAMQSREAY